VRSINARKSGSRLFCLKSEIQEVGKVGWDVFGSFWHISLRLDNGILGLGTTCFGVWQKQFQGLGVIKADMLLHLNSAKDEISWMSIMDHTKWSYCILSNWHEPAWSQFEGTNWGCRMLLQIQSTTCVSIRYVIVSRSTNAQDLTLGCFQTIDLPVIGSSPTNAWTGGGWKSSLTTRCFAQWHNPRPWSLSTCQHRWDQSLPLDLTDSWKV